MIQARKWIWLLRIRKSLLNWSGWLAKREGIWANIWNAGVGNDPLARRSRMRLSFRLKRIGTWSILRSFSRLRKSGGEGIPIGESGEKFKRRNRNRAQVTARALDQDISHDTCRLHPGKFEVEPLKPVAEAFVIDAQKIQGRGM